MKKFILIILVCVLTCSMFVFSGCSIFKKYSAQDIGDLWQSIKTDEQLKNLFDDNGNLSIKFIPQIEQEFDDENYFLYSLRSTYQNNYKVAFDTFTEIEPNKSGTKWSADDLTKIYNALKETKDAMLVFQQSKTDFEQRMTNHYKGQELNFEQKNYYDKFIIASNSFYSASFKMAEATINSCIKNDFDNYWEGKESDNLSWAQVKCYFIYTKLYVSKTAFDFETKFSYDPLTHQYVFDNELSKVVKVLSEVYEEKKQFISSHTPYVFSETTKATFKTYLSRHGEYSKSYEMFEKSLQSLNSDEFRANVATLSDYLQRQSVSVQTSYGIVYNYYKHYVYTIMSSMREIGAGMV